MACHIPIDPADYDFSSTRAIANLDTEPNIKTPSSGTLPEPTTGKEDDIETAVEISTDDSAHPSHGIPLDINVLKLAFKKAAWYSLTLTVIVTVIGKSNAGAPIPALFDSYCSPTSNVLLGLCLQPVVLRILGLSYHVRSILLLVTSSLTRRSEYGPSFLEHSLLSCQCGSQGKRSLRSSRVVSDLS